MNKPELSIVIFAYNEEENIIPVLGELCGWLETQDLSFEIVFVDDGSTDASLQTASGTLQGKPNTCLRHETRRGIGAALKTGVSAATGTWVTFLPADGQIPPEAIALLQTQQRQSASDVVFSVYENRDDGLLRKVLSWGVRTLILLLLGVKMRSDGPYLFRRDLFIPEQLPPDSFFLNFEFPIRVLRKRVPTSVVTIPCRKRLAGVSKSANPRQALAVATDLLDLRWRLFKAR